MQGETGVLEDPEQWDPHSPTQQEVAVQEGHLDGACKDGLEFTNILCGH